jgi:hypothetical protein
MELTVLDLEAGCFDVQARLNGIIETDDGHRPTAACAPPAAEAVTPVYNQNFVSLGCDLYFSFLHLASEVLPLSPKFGYTYVRVFHR